MESQQDHSRNTVSVNDLLGYDPLLSNSHGKIILTERDSIEDKILEIAELSKIYQYLKSIGINASETRASIVNVARMISSEVDFNLSKVNEQFK